MKHYFTSFLAFVFLMAFLGSAYSSGTPGTLKWSIKLGDSAINESSIVMANDGTIYVGSDNYITAISPTGEMIWRRGGTGYGLMIGPDGTIYVGSSNFAIGAYNQSGNLKWSTSGVLSGVGNDGTIYVSDYYSGALSAVNNGAIKWTLGLGGSANHGLAAIDTDGTIYFVSGGNLYAINPNGTIKWTYPGASGTPSLGPDGIIYTKVGTTSQLAAINSDGTTGWIINQNNFVNDAAISSGGVLYIPFVNGGAGYALRHYSALYGGYDSGYFSQSARPFTPAIGNDDTIYSVGGVSYNGAGNNRHLYATTADFSGGWTYTTPSSDISSPPIIGPDGTIYIVTTDGSVYAVYSTSRGPANSVWPMWGQNSRHSRSIPYPKQAPAFSIPAGIFLAVAVLGIILWRRRKVDGQTEISETK